MGSVAPADSGLASGLFNTAQQVGGALGLAVLASLATARTGALLATGYEAVPALAGGYGLAFGIAAAIVAGCHTAGGSSTARRDRRGTAATVTTHRS